MTGKLTDLVKGQIPAQPEMRPVYFVDMTYTVDGKRDLGTIIIDPGELIIALLSYLNTSGEKAWRGGQGIYNIRVNYNYHFPWLMDALRRYDFLDKMMEAGFDPVGAERVDINSLELHYRYPSGLVIALKIPPIEEIFTGEGEMVEGMNILWRQILSSV